MKCWVIVPVKRLTAAKSRLAPILTVRERRELICALLVNTLGTLHGMREIQGKIVVGRDRAVQKIAAGHDAIFVREKEHDGLNRALTRAAQEAVRRGAVMILPADLPLLKKADLMSALSRTGKPPFLKIAPDRKRKGTNLLLIAPPGLIRFSFGDRSLLRHRAAARRAGARVMELYRSSLAEDLDSPEDLTRIFNSDQFIKLSTKSTKSTKVR
jgi:2-phospho-L-lactate guanylyltransferase